jgi:hypothetical protein
MVKIRELSDSQLLSQMEKYEKTYFQLVNERDKRIEVKGDSPQLHTKRERELKAHEDRKMVVEAKASVAPSEEDNDNTQAYQLKFDESEIAEINQAEKAIDVQEESAQDEVRVTQLLRLSQDQLAELRGEKKVAKVVKKKVKKKIKK